MGNVSEFDGLFDNEATDTAAVNNSMMGLSVADANSPNPGVSLKDFDLLKVVGKGAYGKVFQVRKKTGSDTDTIFAMKVVEKNKIARESIDVEHTMAEHEILKTVKSPFICELFYSFQTAAKLYLVLEYLSGGELFCLLNRHLPFKESEARFYCAEIVLALEYLHNQGIIYRDIKPENILLDGEGHVKLSDFNVSKAGMKENTRTYTISGTKEFMAPEVFSVQGHGKEADWWSLGILLHELVTGKTPFKGNSSDEMLASIKNTLVSPPANLSPGVKDLIKKLLKKCAKDRLGAKRGAIAIKIHKFFQGLDWKRASARQLLPPFDWKNAGVDDLSNFDSVTTKEPPVDSPCDAFVPANGVDPFIGFSYVAPSKLENTNGNSMASSSTGYGSSSAGSSTTNGSNCHQSSRHRHKY